MAASAWRGGRYAQALVALRYTWGGTGSRTCGAGIARPNTSAPLLHEYLTAESSACGCPYVCEYIPASLALPIDLAFLDRSRPLDRARPTVASSRRSTRTCATSESVLRRGGTSPRQPRIRLPGRVLPTPSTAHDLNCGGHESAEGRCIYARMHMWGQCYSCERCTSCCVQPSRTHLRTHARPLSRSSRHE
ncbi:hypothetical protein B0H13DRAFT_1045090 [Mycena leptocephala]|nr:hypothetical protein B0H13DRAFT_1045090 [Mycena leptocephala]